MQKYQPLSQLGDGTFGVVIKAQVKATGEFVAIKKMKQPYPNWDECLKLSEVVVLKKLKHSPHVIRLREVFREGHTLYFVFDCMDGDLLAVITGKSQVSGSNIITAAGGGSSGLSLPKVKNYLFQILQGVAHIHKSGFFHRDMKPENILFQRSSPAGSNDADSQEILKIADFGLVKEIRGNPIGTEYVSTRWYRAPELLLQERRYSSPIDVFAVACIGFEMVSGFPLFPGKSENDQLFKVFSVLGTPSPSNWPEAIPKMKQLRFSMPATSGKELPSICPKLAAAPQLVDLLSKMLELNPNRRISASSALQHPFFASSVYGVSEEIVTFKQQQQQQQTALSIAINGSNSQKFPPPPPSIILANITTTSTTKAAMSKNVISFPPTNFESNQYGNNNNTVAVVASKEPNLPPAPITVSSNIATAPLQQYQDRKLPSFAPLGTTNVQQPLQNAANNTHNHSLLSFNQNSNNNNINSVNVIPNNNTNAATVPSSSSFSKLHALGHNSANPNAPIILNNNNNNNNTTKSTKSSSSFKDKLPTPASMLKPLPVFADKPLASADNQHSHNHPASGLSAMEALRRASEVDALLEKLSKFDAATKGGSSISSKAATRSKLSTSKVPATVIPPLMEHQVETTSKSRTNSAAAGKEKRGSKKSSEANNNNKNNKMLDEGTDDTVIIIGVEAENENNNNVLVKPLIPELLLEKKAKTKSKKVSVTEATAFHQEEVSNPNVNNQGVADEIPQYDASPSSLLLLRHPEQVQKESPLAKLLGSARYGPSFTQRGRLRPSKSKSQESQHQAQPQQQLPGLNGGFGDGIIIQQQQQQHENADEVIVEKKKTKKKKQVDAASTINEGSENKNNFLPPL